MKREKGRRWKKGEGVKETEGEIKGMIETEEKEREKGCKVRKLGEEKKRGREGIRKEGSERRGKEEKENEE